MKLGVCVKVCVGALLVAASAPANADQVFLSDGSVATTQGLPPPPAPSSDLRTGHSGFTDCLYVRVDGGGAIYEEPDVTKDVAGLFAGFGGGGGTQAIGEQIDDAGFGEAGIGCVFTEGLRIEATGGVRSKQNVHDGFGTVDFDLQTFTGFVNVFFDITNYAGWTPYIGAGLGVAVHDVTNVVAPAETRSTLDTNFAWSIQGGVSYDLTENVKADFGYRLSDLGEITTDGLTGTELNNILAHEFKVGFRYHFMGY